MKENDITSPKKNLIYRKLSVHGLGLGHRTVFFCVLIVIAFSLLAAP